MEKDEVVGLSLSDRMKRYEATNRYYLTPKQPVIVRVDGRSFSRYTKQKWCKKPFSDILTKTFQQTTLSVCEELMNCVFAYHQSDEVTFILKDYEKKEQQQLFGGNLQKITSTVASKFTAYFNKWIVENLKAEKIAIKDLKLAEFDARTFSLPIHEVTNCVIWRQRDCVKNSITQYALGFFSSKELHKKHSNDKIEMLKDNNTPWENLPIHLQRGCAFKKVPVEFEMEKFSKKNIKYYADNNILVPETIIRNKWSIDLNMPILSEQKDYLETIVYKTEDTE